MICNAQTVPHKPSAKKVAKFSVNNPKHKLIYVFENDTLIQTVEIVYYSKKRLEFKEISKNKKRNLEAKIEGIATKHGGNSEMDEDLEGNAYFVEEYIHSKSVWLAFRIDINTKTTMRIFTADNIPDNRYCPFHSFGLLKKR